MHDWIFAVANASDNDLASLFECPVCFDYALPPIMQCQSGHIVCSNCRAKLNMCPTCRGPLGKSWVQILNCFIVEMRDTTTMRCLLIIGKLYVLCHPTHSLNCIILRMQLCVSVWQMFNSNFEAKWFSEWKVFKGHYITSQYLEFLFKLKTIIVSFHLYIYKHSHVYYCYAHFSFKCYQKYLFFKESKSFQWSSKSSVMQLIFVMTVKKSLAFYYCACMIFVLIHQCLPISDRYLPKFSFSTVMLTGLYIALNSLYISIPHLLICF